MCTYFKNLGQRYGFFGEVVMGETHIIIYLQFLTMCLVQNKGIREWEKGNENNEALGGFCCGFGNGRLGCECGWLSVV